MNRKHPSKYVIVYILNQDRTQRPRVSYYPTQLKRRQRGTVHHVGLVTRTSPPMTDAHARQEQRQTPTHDRGPNPPASQHAFSRICKNPPPSLGSRPTRPARDWTIFAGEACTGVGTATTNRIHEADGPQAASSPSASIRKPLESDSRRGDTATIGSSAPSIACPRFHAGISSAKRSSPRPSTDPQQLGYVRLRTMTASATRRYTSGLQQRSHNATDFSIEGTRSDSTCHARQLGVAMTNPDNREEASRPTSPTNPVVYEGSWSQA